MRPDFDFENYLASIELKVNVLIICVNEIVKRFNNIIISTVLWKYNLTWASTKNYNQSKKKLKNK